MTRQCEQLLDALERGPLEGPLAEHAANCLHCRAVVEAHADLTPPPTGEPNSGFLERVRGQVHDELAKQPVAPPWWRDSVWVLVASGVTAIVAVIALGNWRVVGNHSIPPVIAAYGLLLLGAMAWSAFAAFAPGRGWLRSGGPLLLVGITMGLVGFGGSKMPYVGGYLATGMPCALVEYAVSIPPLLFTLWLLLRCAEQPSRAVLAGLSTGTAGILALHIHCPIGVSEHLMVFHMLPWATVALLGIFLRRRMKTRSYAP